MHCCPQCQSFCFILFHSDLTFEPLSSSFKPHIDQYSKSVLIKFWLILYFWKKKLILFLLEMLRMESVYSFSGLQGFNSNQSNFIKSWKIFILFQSDPLSRSYLGIFCLWFPFLSRTTSKKDQKATRLTNTNNHSVKVMAICWNFSYVSRNLSQCNLSAIWVQFESNIIKYKA